MKKAISILTVLAMILGILTLSAFAEDSEENVETENTAIELPDDTFNDSDFVIRIVHTNDIHARIEENEGSDIIAAAEEETQGAETEETESPEITAKEAETTPETGENSSVVFTMIIIVISAGSLALLTIGKKIRV